MLRNKTNKGSVIILVVFATAFLAVLVAGMLQLNTEELQVMQNHVNATKAVYVAKAGLNDAMYELRNDSGWDAGFANKNFGEGSYTVTVSGSAGSLTVVTDAVMSTGYNASLSADVTVSQGTPNIIRIDSLRINE
ncbi:MAG: hypothetical protein KAS23_11410 [Anaerohalosphaera sp.]|nr:hypothetical protein [Anaerohalosphaera sp.]